MHHTTGHASNRDDEQPPVGRVFVSSLQGDINTKEQKRREQVKMERNLRAQIEDNEKRRSGEKHRGGGNKNTDFKNR